MKKITLVMFLADSRALVVMGADMVKVYEKNCSREILLIDIIFQGN